jgi:hypothetical protein
MNYSQVKSCLARRQRYKHGSSHAERTDTEYKVYSYKTLILTYNLLSGSVSYFNDTYYSRTTSRLQNMLRVAFDIEYVAILNTVKPCSEGN